MLLIEVIELCLKKLIKWIFNKNSASNDKNKVVMEDLNKLKDVKHKEEFGYSANRRQAITFNSINFKDHTFVVGGTGYGKTNLFKLLWENDLKKNKPLIIIDPKPTLNNIAYFRELNELYERAYCIINPADPSKSYKYNPIQTGDLETITQRIMDSFVWENLFYKNESQRRLQDAIAKIGFRPTFSKIYDQLMLLDKKVQTNISGLITQIHNFGSADTRYGSICNARESYEVLDIEKIRNERASIYFALPSMIETDKARTFGKLISTELAQHCGKALLTYSEEYLQKENPFSVYIDEAHDMLTMNSEPLFTQGRAAGLSVCVATQTATILNRVGPEFLNTLFTCAGNRIVFRQAVKENITLLTDSVGTFEDIKSTSQTIEGEIGERGSMRDVHKYKIEPDVIRNLPTGGCVLIRSREKLVDLLKIKNVEITDTFKRIEGKILEESKTNIYPNKIQRLPVVVDDEVAF